MPYEGYAIVPPISPWDEKHREAIEMDTAKRTIGGTPGEAWSIYVRRGLDSIDETEMTRRVQHWHDRGYRLRKVRLEFIDGKHPGLNPSVGQNVGQESPAGHQS